MKEQIKSIIKAVGEDPGREGLKKTPERVEEVYRFLTSGYAKSLKEVVNGAVYAEDSKDMIIVKDIEFFSTCEHHLLPFFGRCHIGYIPEGKVIGLSKLARIVDMFSRRMQLQERITSQIAKAIDEVLKPKGVAVVMEANHLCMMMRGVEKQNSKAVTSSMLGAFKKRPETRAEFLNLIGLKSI